MIKKPEFGDIWKINNSVNGIIFNVEEDYVQMICKDTITGKIFFYNETLMKGKDNLDKYMIFNNNYEYLGKSKLIDMLFEVKK